VAEKRTYIFYIALISKIELWKIVSLVTSKILKIKTSWKRKEIFNPKTETRL
jgi:hypothetical protein